MYRTTQRIRKAGVAALVAATVAASGLVFAPAASADAAVAADLTLTASSVTTIGVGKANQAAGDETLTITPATDTLTAGDQVLITVEDSDGSTCALGDTLAFSALPTVTKTGTATIVSTLESSGLGCGTNRLRLNVTGSGTASVAITGIQYTVGAAASVGLVDVATTLNGGAIASSDSNAFITTAILTGNNPAVGAAEASGFSTISPIVIAEQTATAADTGLCLTFSNNSIDTAAPAPTVAVSGGTDSVALTVNANSIYLVVTPSAPASTSTITISGVRVDNSSTGLQTATLFSDDNNDCAGGNTGALSAATTVGYIGDINRRGGADRFTTAQVMFEQRFDCNFNAIIARADLFPDALAAAYLAGHVRTGILLTHTDSVPAATLNALRNEGVKNVYLMGATEAISSAVATQLDGTTAYDCGGSPASPASTLTVQRIGGADRFETARLVAEFPGLLNAGTLDINNDGDCNDAAKTAIVASGVNFPDAVAAGPLAYIGSPHGDCGSGELPLLLSHTTSIPSDTLAALTNLGIVNVVVVGGPAAVSDGAVAQLTAAGYNVRRISGANRMATAAALATAMMREWDYDCCEVGIARGDLFPDALTAGPFAGDNHYPILLTASPTDLSSESAAVISGWNTMFGDVLDDFDIFGGTSAVSSAVVQAALNAASQQ